jgi:hypothetical protein
MRVSSSTIAELCKRFGPALKLPPGIDGAKLLWALAGNESSFGSHCGPRHENGYCYGGKYFDPALTALWGCLAHMSYGPWQVMYPNISKGSLDPRIASGNHELTCNAAVQLINDRILEHEHATTIEQIADAYNSGDWRDANVPVQYIADLVKHYALAVGSVQ